MIAPSDLLETPLRLETRWLGQTGFAALAETSSTSDEIGQLARSGAPHGFVVVADRQTAGRGRQGRAWQSPAGANLYLSVLLRPRMTPAALPPIALACGLAIAEAADAAGARTAVKWPNDVLACGRAGGPARPARKLAGVLVESATSSAGLSFAIVGVGCNVNQRDFPPELASIATSLVLETGREHDRTDVLASVLLRLEAWIDRFLADGPGPIVAAVTPRLFGVGEEIRTAEGMRGRIAGLAVDGALRLETESGPRRVVAGEVILV